MPPKVVFTPLALLTAPRDKEPVTGIDLAKEDTMLQSPMANISCVASMAFPSAVEQPNIRINNYLMVQLLNLSLLSF